MYVMVELNLSIKMQSDEQENVNIGGNRAHKKFPTLTVEL